MEQRLPTLDALRGLAALSVMWFHFTKHMIPAIGTGIVYTSGRYGWLGVEVFFVISGFVIPYAMHRVGYTISCYGRFLLKRITRLDPPYLLSIVFIIAYQYVLTRRSSYQGPPFQISLPQVLCHFAYLNVIFGYEWLNGVFWSLAIEFQYYLLIGLLFPLLFNKRARYLTLASLLILSFILHTDGFIFSYLGFFLLGFITLFYHLKEMTLKHYLIGVLILSASLMFNASLVPALVGTAGALTIAFVRLEFRALSFFGLISYSLYLLHWPLGWPILGLVESKTGSAYLALAIAVAVTIFAAFLYYLAIERPSQRLASRFSYKPRRQQAMAFGASEYSQTL